MTDMKNAPDCCPACGNYLDYFINIRHSDIFIIEYYVGTQTLKLTCRVCGYNEFIDSNLKEVKDG